MREIDKAKTLLVDSKTCVLVKGEKVLESERKGIAPILFFMNNGVDLNGYVVADRIVGKAAALLFVNAGIKEVYGEVMSESGIIVLKEHNIPYSYKIKTERIINRKGDDICPMEKTVLDIEEPSTAYKALNEKVRELANNQ